MTLPNLERKDLKLFANDAAAQDNIAVFGSLASANPQFSKDIEAIQNLPAFLQGWAGAITGDASPALEDFNALFYVLFYQMSYLFQKGVAQWKATTDYYKGSFTTDGNGALYASVVDNNVGNDPATDDGTHWAKFPTPAEVASKVAKSGDTMSGQLKMSGENEVRFGTNDNNYYFIKKIHDGTLEIYNNNGKGLFLQAGEAHAPFYWDGTNAYRLLTTADISPIQNNLFPNFNAGVQISSGTVLTFNALVIAKGSPGGFNTIVLYADGKEVWAGGVSENTGRFRAGGAYCGKGTTITATNANTITAYPMRES